MGYEVDEGVAAEAAAGAAEYGTTLTMGNDPVAAVTGANVVVTDTWVSMGEEAQAAEKIATFDGYKVTAELMAHGEDDCVFMHCMPRHPEEVSDEIFYSDRSLVFGEAENRMWTVMALMMSLKC